MRPYRSILIRLIIAAAALAAVVVLWRVAGVREIILDFIVFLDKVARKSGPAGALAFLALATFASSVGPITVVPLVPTALRVWGLPLTAVMLMLGAMLGAGLTYLIGRFAGGPVARLFVRPERLKQWKSAVPARATFFIAVLIKFAMPAEVGYAFGIIRYGLGDYLLVTFVAYIPLIAAILWGSEAFIEGRLLPVILSITSVAALSIMAAVYLRKKRK